MTRWDTKKRKPNWHDIVKWEDDNKALVMWICTVDCIKERAKEKNKNLQANYDQIHEFIYHSRRGWDMEQFKNSFKDFVIELLEDNYG